MRAKKKIWALIAIVLIFCGVAFGFVGFVLAGFDFKKINGEGKEVTNEQLSRGKCAERYPGDPGEE